MDMPLIRQWWCLFLMERFTIEGHGQRFAHWTDEARALLQGRRKPVYRVRRGNGITETCPEHVQVATDRSKEEKRLVDIVLHSQEAEQHFVDVLNGKDRFLKEQCPEVPVFLHTEENQDTLFKHLQNVIKRHPTTVNFTDEVEFIMAVMFPEAIIYALTKMHNTPVQQAEQCFLARKCLQPSERAEFERHIWKRLKQEAKL